MLFHPYLVERPEFALMVAGGFAAVAALTFLDRRRRTPITSRSWPCLAVAVAWALYAGWEAALQGKGDNIRVDLLLIHPLLTLLSALALVSVLRRARRPAARPDDDPVVPVAGPSKPA